MSNLIIVNKDYHNEGALQNVVNYILNDKKTHGISGGRNVLLNCPCEYMEYVKRYFCKTGGKLIQHFILSFSDDDPILVTEAYEIGYEVCALYPEYQLVFGVHQNTEHLHIHWAMNPVNMNNGTKFNFTHDETCKLLKGASEILDKYGIACNLRFNNEEDTYMLQMADDDIW